MNPSAGKPGKIVFYVLAFLIVLLILELSTRAMIKPSPYCFGTFFNLELGPCDMKHFDIAEDYSLLSTQNVPPDMAQGIKNLKTDDLMGAFDEDSILTFTTKKNYVSSNGWWQTNNFGARYRKNVLPEIPPGHERILVFGESFANCRGVRQEESWPYAP